MQLKTVSEVLQGASLSLRKSGIAMPRFEAELLLSYVTGYSRIELFEKQTERIKPATLLIFDKALKKRCAHKPLAYITGEKYFYGYRFLVNDDVLIPRPETELIVDRVAELIKPENRVIDPPYTILDLGTGTGNIAITLALVMPGTTEVWAVDISKPALSVAQKNAQMHAVRDKIIWRKGNYFQAIEKDALGSYFNLIVANPPYVSEDEFPLLPITVREYEPKKALFGGKDGLDGYRSIIREIKNYVRVPAILMMEAGCKQKEQIEQLCRSSNLFHDIKWHHDLAGHNRLMEGLIQALPCRCDG